MKIFVIGGKSGSGKNEVAKMVNEFYDYPTFCKVLNNRAWKGLGKKYIVVGWLMKLQMINLLVLLSKI